MQGRVIRWSVVLLALLAACTAASPPTASPPAEETPLHAVSVTGQVVPAVWATLSAPASGLVIEVAVAPGDEVASGDVLLRLDPTDARLAVQQAEAALAAAQAQQALLLAGPRPEEIAAAEAQLTAARAALAQAVAERDRLLAGADQAEIAAAQAEVAAAQAQQLAARLAHDQTLHCTTVTLPDGSQEQACPALGAPEEQARYNLHAADEALAAAQARLDALTAGAEERRRVAEAAVWAATAQRNEAQARLDLLRAGPTDEQLAAAEAEVAQASAALATAQAALERCTLRAPFAGTVGAVHVRLGELVTPGLPLVTLGDLSTLQVETTDLDEVDVARVALGQAAVLTFDALPERTFTGRVVRIAPMAEPGAGGAAYRVVIALDELDPALRWGMTAFVDIG